MKLLYTEQAVDSLRKCLEFLATEVSVERQLELRDRLLARADQLLTNPYLGQKEVYLEHLGQSHRRIVEDHYKIIYRLEGDLI